MYKAVFPFHDPLAPVIMYSQIMFLLSLPTLQLKPVCHILHPIHKPCLEASAEL